MKKYIVLLVCIMSTFQAYGWWPYSQIKKAAQQTYTAVVKPAVQAVNTAVVQPTVTAVNAVVNAVTRDTKATRAIDYAARKAAFEASKATAQGALKLAEETTKLAIQGAQGALTVAQAASTAALETIKQTGGVVLEGSQWVVKKQLEQFDVTEIKCTTSLQELAAGKLSKTSIKLTVIGVPLSITADLDIKHPEETAKQLGQQAATEIIKIAMPVLK